MIKLRQMIRLKNILLISFIFVSLSGCSTMFGMVEGGIQGAVKDSARAAHYSLCLFTELDCL